MRLYIFAIGGTGARVLKSLVMLSAAGVRPVDADGRVLSGFEIVPIVVDPHKAGEDLKRTERLIGDYRLLRRQLYGDGEAPAEGGFFANKITLLGQLGADTAVTPSAAMPLAAVEHQKFRDFVSYNTMGEANQALTSLLFADYQLENNMSIGFVGSPNIGAVALNQIKDSDEFKTFASVFAEGDRVFFVSSIFGGTGAAGFPILLKNIRQADTLEVSNKDLLRRAPVGALTVLPYFNIEHSEDSRICKADFVMKTQSALHYYNKTLSAGGDASVNVLYYVGDQVSSRPYAYDPGENGQRNRAHLVELVGALAPLRFAGMPAASLADDRGCPLPTQAFEYGLEKDTDDVTFSCLGSETRAMVYKPLVSLHLLMLFMRTGLPHYIGRGFTADKPKIGHDFLKTEFFRTLHDNFLRAYAEWLLEMNDNHRSVHFFSMDSTDMATAIVGVGTRRRPFGLGRATVSNDTLVARMNALSRDTGRYSRPGCQAFKLLDLFARAASDIIDTRYDNIN